MQTLFFYGSLRHVPLLELVLGHPLQGGQACAAALPDHAVFWARDEMFPLIRAQAGARAEGLAVSGLGGEDIARLNFYEGGFDYDLRDVVLENGAMAQVYFPVGDRWKTGAAWRLEDWVERDSALSLRAAQEVMSYYGRFSPVEIAARFPMIRSRARAWLSGQNPPANRVRSGLTAADVEVGAATRPYVNYFALEDIELRHRRFDGGVSERMQRAVFLMAEAVTVLPYDPVRDRVLLVEQFRAGPFARGDIHPWTLEPVAGRIDPGETPQDTARRETLEEAGIALTSLEFVARYYPSPGAVSEYLYSYIGLADLPDVVAGLGGVADEHEDIRSHLLSYEALMELLSTGEAENGPLVLSALWLAANRDRLRSGA